METRRQFIKNTKPNCVCDHCIKADVCSKQDILKSAVQDTDEQYEDINFFNIMIKCNHYVGKVNREK